MKKLEDRFNKKCGKCNCIKPPRAHHCSICKRCVLGMDHHCPWMNNCIGIKNHKSFILFCMYTALASIYAAIRSIIELGLCFSDDYECNTYDSMGWKVFGFIGFSVCILFACFTVTMFFDQVHMKYTDTSTIDSM